MKYLVVTNLNGGDFAYSVLDQARWDQLVEYRNSDEVNWEIASWIASDDTDVETPAGFENFEKKGSILKTYYTQEGVIEPVAGIGPIHGILHLCL